LKIVGSIIIKNIFLGFITGTEVEVWS